MGNSPVIETISEKCRRCYGCVRECPARAIKVENGQARVIPERCVGCGNCYRACALHAKKVLDGKAPVERFLAETDRLKVALLAPSYTAVPKDYDPARIVGALRRLGFDKVCNVAFGADLNARLYAKLRKYSPTRPVISVTCPAAVYLIQKFAPELVPHLAPIASPMVMMARVVRELWGPDIRVVFIGPCIGKKKEAHDPVTESAVDEALTFIELEEMFNARGIVPAETPESDTDGPQPGLGQLFPDQDGLLKSADIREGALDNCIVTANGRRRCIWVLEELLRDRFRPDFVDLLMCEGCINGPAMISHHSLFWRKQRIVDHARQRVRNLDPKAWEEVVTEWLGKIDTSRKFTTLAVVDEEVPEADLVAVLRRMRKFKPEDELNCGACGYPTCREKAAAVCRGIAEIEMCLPFIVDELEGTCRELKETNTLLQATQQNLVQTEKLASMGQLAAGVAHEINNPLGTILMFSHLIQENLQDRPDIREDLDLVVKEAHRCKTIVSGLLNFARQNRVQAQVTDMVDFLTGLIRQKTVDNKFAGYDLRLECQPGIGSACFDPDQIRQVLDNLLNNAVEAMEQPGAVFLRARRNAERNEIEFSVEDQGSGIPEENLKRIFTPFFTTKKLGRGTGLGLAIVYGIVKMHGGNIDVKSTVGKGTVFVVTIPDRTPEASPGSWI